jgi:protein O-mannosyl-transferase
MPEIKSERNLTLKQNFIGVFLILFSVTLVYLNHFDNEFHFDDSHAIVNNTYIRDIKNIPIFFTDATTVSSLPANQSYRPLLTTFAAIDFYLGGELNPFYFHLTTFIFFLLQLLLMFFLIKKMASFSLSEKTSSYLALFTIAWYGLHTAIAETVNYVSARSDSISTFFGLLSLSMFIFFPLKRKWGLYLIPLVLGVLVKPAVLVFPGIIFLYILFFEKGTGLNFFYSKENLKKTISAFTASLPSLLLCIALFVLQNKMTPETFVPGNTSKFNYIITQPFVIAYYFKLFFLPTSLSADTDWNALETIWDYRFFAGSLFLLAIIISGFVFSEKKETRLISFGIFWFLIALLPSSSIIPFAEVLNDHRIFFPYVGLIMSVVFALFIIIKPEKSRKRLQNSLLAGAVILSLNAYGAFKRNILWDNGESLWYDVTIKSPANGRGLMNYGLTQMKKGDYARAEEYFLKGLEFTPNYSYLHVNLGILKNSQGEKQKAEEYFKKALNFNPTNPNSYYYYAYFLRSNNRLAEAEPLLLKLLELSPGQINGRHLLMEIYQEWEEWDKLHELASNTLKLIQGDATTHAFIASSQNRKGKISMLLDEINKNPTPEKYLNLSLLYYKKKDFTGCIEACNKALELKSDFADAYNNICSAYNELKEFDNAEQACMKAIGLKPDFSLAHNNLKYARSQTNKITDAEKKAQSENTASAYLNLSLAYYHAGLYDKCIDACYLALKLKPDYPEAYNNICSAYNMLEKYEKAIDACNKALEINPTYQLAKNNLNAALQKKK